MKDATDTTNQPGADQMTDKNVLKLKMIQTLIEAIDLEDEEDAKEAVKQIKALLGGGDGK